MEIKEREREREIREREREGDLRERQKERERESKNLASINQESKPMHYFSDSLQASSPMDSTSILAVLSVILSIVLLFFLFNTSSKRADRPPGPSPWPILGNLPHLLRRLFSSQHRLHAALSAIAYDYGPVVHIRLGIHDVIVVSSPSSAEQALKSSDRALRGRFVPSAYRVPEMIDVSLLWNFEGNESWRCLRALTRAHLLSLPSLSRQAPGREKKALEMAEFLLSRAGEEVKIGEVVFTTIFNVIGNLLFSRDVLSLEEGKGWFPEMKTHMARMIELGTRPSIDDVIPWLVGRVDIQGLRHEVKDYLNKLHRKFDEILQQRNDKMVEEDFSSVMLRSDLTRTQLNVLIQDIFTAGTDTATALAEWLMSELVRNPEIMNRVKTELTQVMGSPGSSNLSIPEDSQLSRMTLLHASVKEALRLHPPAPLIYRRATEDCEIAGYKIHKGCGVLVNVWAIGRDPRIWDNPLEFSPERFLSRDVDYKGVNFEFIPFGAGARMCLGMAMGVRFVMLMVAVMVHNFEWVLPEGMRACQLSMEEKPGFLLERKDPLVLIPKPRTDT